MIEALSDSTICAISTPSGVGGIAVLRISGTQAFAIADHIFKAKNPAKTIENQPAYTLLFGEIVNPETSEVVDEVIVAVFRAPHSFTGENCVEISCHGSFYIQQKLLQLLLHAGCVMAQPGEFTQRAFLHGKMDLSQAEAVADLIASTSEYSNRLAMSQMRGFFSTELATLRSQLLTFNSLVELELDFSEEDVEFADRTQMQKLAAEIEQKIQKLTNSFSVGNAIKNGIPVAIVGETNVGKSTLLNLLVGENKALVSDIHGTTRDSIEDTVNIEGVQFRFIDTAGIRQTQDVVENMGIERTYKMIEQAQIVLWLIDCTEVSEHIEWLADRIIKRTSDKKLIIVFNKVDKIHDEERLVLEQLFEPYNIERLYISAGKRQNIEALQTSILRAAQLPKIANNDVIITNLRHYEALKNALQCIQAVKQGLANGISGDLLAEDVRGCSHYLGLITGQITTDEVLGNIFSKFCIGK